MTGLATETNIAVEVLVGEMPIKGCEHKLHGQPPHSDGDEQYIKIAQPCGCDCNVVIFCGTYTTFLLQHGEKLMMCKLCRVEFPLGQALFPLGPANKGTQK